MWVKKGLVEIILVLHFFIVSSSSLNDERLIDEKLPSIWEDENVTRMVREILARDLQRENENMRMKRQHKRDLTSSKVANVTQESTRNIPSDVSEKSFKKPPPKVIQTKNRVSMVAQTTRATVRPSLNPVIASNANFGNLNVAASKNKVRIIVYACGCFHNDNNYALVARSIHS